jgi:hypothetical protein
MRYTFRELVDRINGTLCELPMANSQLQSCWRAVLGLLGSWVLEVWC